MTKETIKLMVIYIAILIAMSSIIVSAKTDDVSVTVKHLEYDTNVGYPKYLVNIKTSELGHLTYIENYYSIDSYGKEKFYSSGRYYDKDLTTNNITFEMHRPKSRSGRTFSLIEMIVRIDNNTVLIKWVDLHKRSKMWNFIPVIPEKQIYTNFTKNISKEDDIKKNLSNKDKKNLSTQKNKGRNISATTNTHNVSDDTYYQRKNMAKTSGFDIIISIVTIFMIYLWGKKL